MNGINLVPNDYQRTYYRRWYVGIGIVVMVIIMIMLVALVSIPVYQIKQEEEKLAQLDIKLKKEQFKQLQDILRQIESKKAEKSNIQAIIEEMDIPTCITRKTIDTIIASVPKDVIMNEIKIQNSDSKIQIQGEAKHFEYVAEYIIRLHHTNQFENITYSTSKQKNVDSANSDQWIEYNVEIQLPLQRQDDKINEVENKEDRGEEEYEGDSE